MLGFGEEGLLSGGGEGRIRSRIGRGSGRGSGSGDRFGRGRGRYEEATRGHHDHLIDISTGRVIEFHSADIEKLQEKIARELGFSLVGHRLELYGEPLDKKKPRKG